MQAASESGLFAPLPLHPRSALEIFDVAIRVYKQYGWVLLRWSVLVSLLGCIPFINWISLFAYPLIVGACVCCLTAAVRGQPVKFKQCAKFTEPRYWKIIGALLTGGLLFFVIAIMTMMLSFLAFGVFAMMMASMPTGLSAIGAIVFMLLFFYFISLAIVWVGMAQIVVCMEGGLGVNASYSRAFGLLNGNWVRLAIVTTLVGMASIALAGAVLGAEVLIFGVSRLPGLTSGYSGDPFAQWLVFAPLLQVSISIVSALCYPLYYVTLGLFYYDLRIRKEGLDIEWNAHLAIQATTPEPPTGAYPQSHTPNQPMPATEAAAVNATDADLAAKSPGATPEAGSEATIVTCLNCGATSPAGQVFCMSCGSRLAAGVDNPVSQW